MKAIILAAGRGSRMGESTDNLPKCMIKLWEKTLIDWQINTLRKAGISEIGIVVGYKSEKIIVDEVQYFYNLRWKETNILASLLTARTWLENYGCIVAYSDILYTSNTIKKIMESKGEIAITHNLNFYKLWSQRFENPLEDLETFKTDDQSMLLEIGNRVGDIKEIEGQFMGLLKITPNGFKEIAKGLNLLDQNIINKLDMTGMLKILLDLKVKINTIPCSDFWIEVDNKDDVKLYESWDKPHL